MRFLIPAVFIAAVLTAGGAAYYYEEMRECPLRYSEFTARTEREIKRWEKHNVDWIIHTDDIKGTYSHGYGLKWPGSEWQGSDITLWSGRDEYGERIKPPTLAKGTYRLRGRIGTIYRGMEVWFNEGEWTLTPQDVACDGEEVIIPVAIMDRIKRIEDLNGGWLEQAQLSGTIQGLEEATKKLREELDFEKALRDNQSNQDFEHTISSQKRIADLEGEIVVLEDRVEALENPPITTTGIYTIPSSADVKRTWTPKEVEDIAESVGAPVGPPADYVPPPELTEPLTPVPLNDGEQVPN